MDILSLDVWCLARSPNKFPKCQTVFSQIFNDVAGTALSPSGSQIGNAQRLLVVPHRSIPAEQKRQNRMRETVCVAPNAGVVVESLLVTHTEQNKKTEYDINRSAYQDYITRPIGSCVFYSFTSSRCRLCCTYYAFIITSSATTFPLQCMYFICSLLVYL